MKTKDLRQRMERMEGFAKDKESVTHQGLTLSTCRVYYFVRASRPGVFISLLNATLCFAHNQGLNLYFTVFHNL